MSESTDSGEIAASWPELVIVLWKRHNFSFASGAALLSFLLAIIRCVRNVRARMCACTAWILIAVIVYLVCSREATQYVATTNEHG